MAGKPKPEADRTQTRSVSLVPGDWSFLRSVADQLRAERAGERDPADEPTVTMSEAIRHLIRDAQKTWPRDKAGRFVFRVAPSVARTFDPSTGTSTTTSMTWSEIVDVSPKNRPDQLTRKDWNRIFPGAGVPKREKRR